MKRVLTIILGIVTISLCGICIFQWKREAELRGIQKTLSDSLRAEVTAREEGERKSTALESEIRRISALRAELETNFLAAQEDLSRFKEDMAYRGYTLFFMSQALEAANAELAMLQQRTGDSVTTQNTAITKQNAMLKELAAERDAAINKLNARTREFNELVKKYNALSAKKD